DPVAITDALTHTTSQSWSAGLLLSSADAAGDPAAHFDYDGNRRLTAVTDPLGRVSETSYDANGNPAEVTAPLGDTSTTVYASLARLILTSDADGHAVTTAYDAYGDVIYTRDAAGAQTYLSYDGRALLTETVETATGAAARTTSLGYD